MPTRDASAGPPHGEERRGLTEASLRSLEPGESIDSIVPQLRVRVGSGLRRVVSFRVYYWSRAQGRPRTRTIGRWPSITLAQARAQARQILAQAQLRQDEPPARPEPRRAGISLRALSEAVLASLRRRRSQPRASRFPNLQLFH
jgi:hypothetical protein